MNDISDQSVKDSANLILDITKQNFQLTDYGSANGPISIFSFLV